ncbi:hypothetical protein J6590_096054 [Homalodisca vitripennis]|nr:hypothetical protein J6590_096054 [Homalodisca vitripennis]
MDKRHHSYFGTPGCCQGVVGRGKDRPFVTSFIPLSLNNESLSDLSAGSESTREDQFSEHPSYCSGHLPKL